MIRDYIEAAARQPFTRDEAIELIERIPPRGPFADAAVKMIRSVLKMDPGDPLFRLYEYRYHLDPFQRGKLRRKRLESIMKEAVRRKNDSTIQAIRHELDKLQLPPPLPPFEPQFDSPEESEFVPESYAVADMLEDFEASLNAKERRQFAELQEMLRNAPERELRRFRETLPAGMPPEILELLLDKARGSEKKPAPYDRPGPKPSKPKQGDRRQRELFDL
jgi:hypothetical protein